MDNRFNLNNRKHAGFGIASTIVGGSALVVFLTSIFVAMLINRKNGDLLIIGVLGIACLIAVFIGFFFGIFGLNERDSTKFYSIIGTVLNGTMLLILLYTYSIGYGG